MLVRDALICLGSNRTIWIDDVFNESPGDLAKLLMNSREIAKECGIEGIIPFLEAAEFGEEKALTDLIEFLSNVSSGEREKIRQSFFAQESSSEEFPSEEISSDNIAKVCELLGISAEDRWNFDRASAELRDLCSADDSNISYIVDLNEAGGAATRGLDILKLLWKEKSKGTAFILTHDAEVSSEADKESQLRDILLEDGEDKFGIPVCVISKQRIFDAEGDALRDAVNMSIKRAGLRRSLSEVVIRATEAIGDAFYGAANSLLSIPPEDLEAYVFERGYKEGVSELHVVERILSSQIAQKLRVFFGTDAAALDSVKRLRSLRAINLDAVTTEPNPSLAEFRLAEVWETPELINSTLAPIACGDVFEPDFHEASVRNLKKKFIVLAQPCDIAIRPEGQKRSLETAFFVPLIKARENDEPDIRKPKLPCRVDGEYWACDLRNVTQVKLGILDLASLRTDGRVRLDEGHTPNENLFVALRNAYLDRTEAATKALADGLDEIEGSVHVKHQLTFDSKGMFSHFCRPFVRSRSGENEAMGIPRLPKRITWGLRRCGRVRIPYSISLLDQYLGVMSRQAFDLDYIAPGFGDGKPKAPAERKPK